MPQLLPGGVFLGILLILTCPVQCFGGAGREAVAVTSQGTFPRVHHSQASAGAEPPVPVLQEGWGLTGTSEVCEELPGEPGPFPAAQGGAGCLSCAW